MNSDVQSVPIRRGEDSSTVATKTATAPKKHFVAYATSPAYETDDTDLLPSLKKPSATVPVTLADASAVSVKTAEKKSRVFHAAQRPRLFFSGNVTVTDVPDDEPEELEALTVESGEDEAPITPPPSRSLKVAVTDTNKTSVPVTNETKQEKSIQRKLSVVDHSSNPDPVSIAHGPALHNPHGIIGMRRERISSRNPLGGTLKMQAKEVKTISAPTSTTVSLIPVAMVAFAICAGVVSVAVLVGFEAEITQVSGSVSESITYSLDGLRAAVRDALP